MMIRTLLALVAVLALNLPASAEVVIQELLVRMKNGEVNVRVTLRNPGPRRQPGPVLIDLYIRDNESEQWYKCKTWNDISVILPGNKISRDFFSENDETLKAMAADKVFEARAVVRVPGGVKDVEQTAVYQDTE